MKFKMNKKKIIVAISILIFIAVSIFIAIYFLKVEKVTYNDIYKNKIVIGFKNKISSCKVTTKYYLSDDNIKKIFDTKSDKYTMTKTINEKCNKLIKEYNKIKDNIEFKLNGDDKITIEVHNAYEEKGVISKVNKKDKTVDIKNDINVKKLGEYKVIYKFQISDVRTDYLYRKVSVVDTTAPIITLNGNERVYINLDNKYEEPGCIATDNYDGDITSSVKITGSVDTNKVGAYDITYEVEDKSGNKASIVRKVVVQTSQYKQNTVTGLTYIKGILVVNKTYGLPSNYDPGVNEEAKAALQRMQSDASSLGLDLRLVSGYRSYALQKSIYNSNVAKSGVEKADTYSARPGYSEHQTGLAFDVGDISDNFGNTESGKWLEQNGHLYGFIIRYPKGKMDITGYKYEPWHIRYLGVDIATKVKNSGLTLEEYLGI